MRSIQPTTQSQSGRKAIDLANDFQNVVSDAQELLKTMGDEGDAKLIEVKKRFQTSLNLARQRFGEVQANVAESMKAAAKTSDDYMHENPWRAVGISVAFGALLGFVLARR